MEDTPQPEQQNQPVIEKPDIANPKAFTHWLGKYVQKPFRGSDDWTHPDGTPYSREEQIEEMRTHMRQMADQFAKMGKKPEEIKSILVNTAHKLREEE